VRTQSLKSLVRNHGSGPAGEAVMEAINSDDDATRLDPSDFSVRELWEAFMGPVGVTLQFASPDGAVLREANEVLEAPMDSTMFAAITQTLLGREVIAAYDVPNLIGDQLVTPYPSKTINEKIPGFLASEGVEEVLEGEAYPESKGIGPKYVTTDVALKKGRIISITEEAVMFDQTGLLLERSRGIGQKAALAREVTILTAAYAVTSPYYPSGVQDANFYQAAGAGQKGNLLVNPMTDWTSIETSRQAFATRTDEEGDPIMVQGLDIVIPDALRQRTIRAVGTQMVVDVENAAAGTRSSEMRAANPLAQLLGGTPRILASSVIDVSLGITNAWLHGDFKKMLRWKEIWPLQTFTVQTPEDPDRFIRDVVAKFKVRYYGGVFAIDWRYGNRNNAA